MVARGGNCLSKSHATVFVFDSVAHHLLTPDVIVLGSELVVLRANDSAFQVQGE